MRLRPLVLAGAFLVTGCATAEAPSRRGDALREVLGPSVQLRTERAGARRSGSGVVVASESLADLVTATRVQVANDGKRTVTDGPFAETREVLGGFYVIDVPDLDVALDWAAKGPGSRAGGSVMVRPVAEF